MGEIQEAFDKWEETDEYADSSPKWQDLFDLLREKLSELDGFEKRTFSAGYKAGQAELEKAKCCGSCKYRPRNECKNTKADWYRCHVSHDNVCPKWEVRE